ncbi:MAG TPA: PDZ domain-containing protein [Chloroflexota bacterium]|nr:PDZ domain-containing protein [Chloroflexota bacterium]
MSTATPRAGRRRFSLPPRAERIINILSIVILVVLVAALVLWRIPSSYQVYLPATAESVASQIYVADHPEPTGRGGFYMTFVEEPDTSLLLSIFGRLDPDASVEPLPKNYSQSQSVQQGKADMLSSEQTAELVALCHVGYPSLCSSGVQVQQIETYSKAGGILQPGDIITAVDGTRVISYDALRAALATHAPGSRVTLTFLRGKQTLTRSVQTVRSPDQPYHAVLGISIAPAAPLSIPSKLPVDVKINPGNIGGPSAGLMFTLGILNRLSPTDLTHGYKIAGTGEIFLDGSVGPIGGVKQKVIGAEWAGAKYFFVPCSYGNYDDARRAVDPSKMMLLPVTSLDDALNYLHQLASNPKPPLKTCPAGQ